MAFFLAAGAVLSLIYWGCYVRAPESWARSCVKTGSVAVLSLASFVAGTPVLLPVALVFCAAGDWFLSRDGQRSFMAGVGAFALGHLSFILLFLQQGRGLIHNINNVSQYTVIISLIFLGICVSKLLWRHAGALRGAVLTYVPVIIGMGIAALAMPLNGGWPLVASAALLFVLSDLILAFETFILPADSPILRVTPHLVWPLYWLAQCGFFVAFTLAPPFS